MAEINPIGPLEGSGRSEKSRGVESTGKNAPEFKDTLSQFLNEVNDIQNKAGESIEKMAAGEITDVHQVMNSVEEAKTAFNMMMEVRNKVMDAYDEVRRMRI